MTLPEPELTLMATPTRNPKHEQRGRGSTGWSRGQGLRVQGVGGRRGPVVRGFIKNATQLSINQCLNYFELNIILFAQLRHAKADFRVANSKRNFRFV